MAYALILKALHRNLVQTAGRLCERRQQLLQVGVLVHTHRTSCTGSRLPLLTVEALSPALGCLGPVQTRRGISLCFAARNRSSPADRDKSVSAHRAGSPGASAAQKVKDAGRDFTYLIVILIGLGVTGGLLYVVFQELFSSKSPNKVYSKAFDKVKSHPEVIGAFGEPVKCYGETTRRGRRQQVSHVEYLKDGLKHMRLKFYIEGSEPGVKGTVHSESKENLETGKYEFRYIFVEVDAYPRRNILVEDNR
ncbi:mitochondrial import inner membrane translocase subunit Tim21-like [Cololabis saira]|uniref:mitochondrial import inner membrane translocase subunit Tim21-like n=1 Tax=Cololabis saira TaxID=129043 RepID=UPI002AD37695|nr:mitochondrial import inner membrane translocase subunit Tim21-like [Cololabis saira]